MPSLVCLNGAVMPPDEARVSVWDRGFLFGDAIYEVFRLYRGRCWLEQEHYARLKRSVHAMEMGGIDLERLAQRVADTIKASQIDEGIVYIQITRGAGPRYHAFPAPEIPPTEFIAVWPYDDHETARQRQTGIATISQPDLRWKRCDIKSTNLLANVLANEHAHRMGAYEAILVGADGCVSEATHSSVLWVRSGRLEGTPDGPGILPGTTRKLIHRLAHDEEVAFAETGVTLDELKRADEVLLLGTSIEILPIVRIDDAPVAGGQPGPLTRRLQAAYRRAVDRWLATPPA
ncbi:MAG TPA: aminotransferase class IV [Isosphaeraceae bacterium]|nr:aminotransferase class IV [Isosphaeraceae bacterium]